MAVLGSRADSLMIPKAAACNAGNHAGSVVRNQDFVVNASLQLLVQEAFAILAPSVQRRLDIHPDREFVGRLTCELLVAECLIGGLVLPLVKSRPHNKQNIRLKQLMIWQCSNRALSVGMCVSSPLPLAKIRAKQASFRTLRRWRCWLVHQHSWRYPSLPPFKFPLQSRHQSHYFNKVSWHSSGQP